MALKIAFRIGHKDVLLSPEQVETVLNTISNSEVVDGTYTKGDDGKYLTVYTLKPFDMASHLTYRFVTEEEYNSLKFITASQQPNT